MRQATWILGVVVLVAGIGQADILVDLGWRVPSVSPETDGRVWNNVPRKYEGVGWGPARTAFVGGVWQPVGELVDTMGALSGVFVETTDISSDGGNNAAAKPPYPANVTVDWWNGQGSNDANPAGIKLHGVPAGTYTLNVGAWYPTDPWVEGIGEFECQGQSFTYSSFEQTPAPTEVFSFTGIVPDGNGDIILWIKSVFPGQTGLSTYNGVSFLELIPEPATLSLLATSALLAIRRRR